MDRGLAETRARAQAAIAAGLVVADGVRIEKSSQLIRSDAQLEYAPEHPWVSRGALKLAHALDVFGVEVAGRRCLDIGASTGGFTEVLLSRGAALVTAVDVGHGQLHPRVAGNPRVKAFERTDARSLTRSHAVDAELVVCDASFIGVAKVLPAPLALTARNADLIVLIKPQYERGPGGSGQIQRDEAMQIAGRVAEHLDGMAGFHRQGLTESPIAGGDGTPEALYWARKT